LAEDIGNTRHPVKRPSFPSIAVNDRPYLSALILLVPVARNGLGRVACPTLAAVQTLHAGLLGHVKATMKALSDAVADDCPPHRKARRTQRET
jgi:hypothetical protein